ncbi:MAG TPA: site-2 protease family protein [Pirellulales bacterium]|nr:site-2 protease family protein [Pirellulales bacterium]
MGLHLIGFSLLNPADLLIALEVALGIGAVIFVHELGHFAVAKWCGVKCEKFYLGFDIGGWKLCKFRWGETEYGIGILPLGGYVKMLGQEDNPARMAEEMERAKLAQAEGEPLLPPGEGRGEGSPLYDPRSFLAKTVPQRMAIISAGVIMNIIFAFVVSTICYSLLGVEQVACVVGHVMPGEAAWKAGLQTGDKIVEIGDKQNPMFRDLQRGIHLGDDLDKGVKVVVDRPGVDERLELKVYPIGRGAGRLAPIIGIGNGSERELFTPPVKPYSRLARLKDGFKPGDEVIAVDGKPVENNLEVEQTLYAHPGATSVTVQHKINDDETKIFNIDIPAIPMQRLGLVMKFGEITAVQDDSPAKAAGIQAGDRLVKIDGREVEGDEPLDPMTLPKQLAERAGETVQLTLLRNGKTIETSAVLRAQTLSEFPTTEDAPVPVPALGLAYAVENQVAAVEPGSPAAAQKIKPGDELVKAVVLPPEDAKEKYHLKREPEPADLEFGPKKHNFPLFFTLLQEFPPECKVELTLKDERKVTLAPEPVSDWLNPDRGFLFKPVLVVQKATSVGEAVSLGAAETRDSLSLVYRFLRKILSGQVSAKGMGGPLTIAEQAGRSASDGLSPFLMFLGMLSANLAVINFLPIPLLDGGHMMFLAWEGIRGKPASEQVMTWCQFIGLFLLASLMLFVMLLDVGVISRS